MSAIKALYTASLLIVATVANASPLANYNLTAAQTYNDGYFSSQTTGTGTALLDSNGTLVAHTQGHYLVYITGVANPVYDLNVGKIETYNGSVNGGIFATASGIFRNTSCYDNLSHSACADGILQLGVDASFLSVSGQFFVGAGGSIASAFHTGSGTTFQSMTLTPSVPVPAAAWLFGSGLVGLVTASKRRK